MSSLSVVERRDLKDREAVIIKGLATFLEVGQALREIRDMRLYRENSETFDDYVKKTFDLTKRRAYQFIEAAQVREHLCTIVHKAELPENEGQYRELSKVPQEDLGEVWQKVQQHSEKTKKPITAKVIKEVAGVEPPLPPEKTFNQCFQECQNLLGQSIKRFSDLSVIQKSPQHERVRKLFEELTQCLKRW